MLRFRMIFAASLLTLASSAAFADTFIVSGPGTVGVSQASSSSATLTYSDRGTQVYSGESWTISAIATTTGAETFTYQSTGYNGYFQAVSYLSAFEGSTTTPVYSSGAAGGFDFTGQITLNLVAGQQYGFIVGGSNYDSDDVLSGSLAVSQNIAPTPEPESLVLLGTGTLGAAGAIRRRLQKA